ncbi:hypothetical protein BDR04DRAFT_409209 [Suillus decipiens]|nr:hypothetical protein BDR04DRAFT_409209 [Suillus decipiens]
MEISLALSQRQWLCYVGRFVLDVVTFILTTKSLWTYSREFRCLYPSDLLYLLVRDATMFFLFNMLNNVTIFVSWTVYANSPYTFLPKGFVSHRCDPITLCEFIACRFSGPLLSVAGQRVVLNLKSLPTRTYATRDLSREVDRQLEAFIQSHHSSPGGQDVLDDPEGGREDKEM